MRSFKSNKSDCCTAMTFIRLLGTMMLVLTLLMSCDVYKQSSSGIYTLKGRVSDVNEENVAGVKIRIEGGRGEAVTDSSGNFSISNVPGHTVTLIAEKEGKILVPVFDSNKIVSNGNSINVEYSTDSWEVEGCDFLLVDRVTIPMIQGTGDISPLNGVHVENVIGVVTQVCFEQAHNNPKFITPDPGHGTKLPQILSNDGFYMQLLPNLEVSDSSLDVLRVDGNPMTSDGIFISTRDSKGEPGVSKWLSSCMFGSSYPQPGDIVVVTGTVTEYVKPDRFNEGRGLNSRTQIDADSVKLETSLGSDGWIDITDDNLLRLTYEEFGDGINKDAYRTLPFNDTGVDALKRASSIFESCEGMLVRIQNPIVVGATFYNTTPVLADGGKKNGAYPDQFNEKWMAPVVQEDDFNTEILFTYYDSLDIGSTFAPDWYGLPQIGTVLTDDTYIYEHGNPDHVLEDYASESSKIFRGVMDYNDNGNYIIYPFRTYNLNTKNDNPGVDYSHLSIKTHDEFRYALNDEAPVDSLYMMGDKSQQEWIHYRMGSTQKDDDKKDYTYTAQYNYKPWKSGSLEDNMPAFDAFKVPWATTDSEEQMSVAVFNLENYTGEGARFRKYVDVANIIVNNLDCPDLIFTVEMGDHDDSENTIIYNNSSYSQTNITNVVSARLNYETLINKIAKETEETGNRVQYDYRQIDPVEYTQAGKPGTNIRVGFMFRTDRVEAYDIGRTTVHMNGLSDVKLEDGRIVPYSIPEELDDGHSSLVFNSVGVEKTDYDIKPDSREYEPYLTLETKKVLAETQTEILGVYDENGKFAGTTLSQSPGFLQDDRFYNSRLPLVGKFKFKPANGGRGEDFYAIALHLYSKGRDDKLYGNIQPPVMTSEIRRAGQCVAVREFIESILALDPNAKIIVGGDVNDFGFTYPIRKMTGEGTDNQVLYDMTAYFMPENERFSYTFNGNFQQLDHIFVSPSLYKDMGSPTPEKHIGDWSEHVFIPHVNSVFSRDRHIQISDHDPIAACIEM